MSLRAIFWNNISFKYIILKYILPLFPWVMTQDYVWFLNLLRLWVHIPIKDVQFACHFHSMWSCTSSHWYVTKHTTYPNRQLFRNITFTVFISGPEYFHEEQGRSREVCHSGWMYQINSYLWKIPPHRLHTLGNHLLRCLLFDSCI